MWWCLISIEKMCYEDEKKFKLVQKEAWEHLGESRVRWATYQGLGGRHDFLMIHTHKDAVLVAGHLKRYVNTLYGAKIWEGF